MLKISDNKLFNSVLYFFIWLFIIAGFSYYQAESFLGAFKYLVYLGAFLFFVLFLRSFGYGRKHYESILLKQLYIIFLILLLGAFFCSLFGFYQFFTGAEQLAKWDDPRFITEGRRIYSIFSNPNLFGAFLAQATAINIGLIFDSLDSKGKLKEYLGLWVPVPLLLIFLVILSALLLTGSRAAIIGASVSIFLSLIYLIWVKKFNIALMLFLTLLFISSFIVCLNPSLVTRFQSLFMGAQYSTNEYRMEVWGTCLEIIKENWVLGIGLGNEVFRKVHALYMKPGFEALSSYSIFLEYFIQAGILGLILFMAILRESFISLLLVCRRYQFVALMIALAISASLVQGLFDTVFFRPQIHFIFWLLIASIVTLKECYLDEGEHERT